MVRADTVEFERSLFDIGALERSKVFDLDLARMQPAVVIHFDDAHGQLEQSIGGSIETAGFNIHDDRQETAKSFGNGHHLDGYSVVVECRSRS